MKRRIASYSTELAAAGADAPEWVQLLPYGTFSGRDGRGPYTLRDQAHAQAVIQATQTYQRSADVPVDYDHQLLFTQQNGQPAIAAGWIKGYEARPDGLWARVEWTAAASSHVAGREYRYLSPVFRHQADGTVTRMVAAALTNLPNLELTALASSVLFSDIDEEPMDLQKLLEALGLPAETAFDQAVAHCQGLAASQAAVTAKAKALAPVVGKTDKDKPEDIVAAASACLTGLATKLKADTTDAGGNPDPAKWAPMDMVTEMQTQLAAMSAQLAGDKAADAIDKAKAEGKLSPAMEGWAKDYATKDLDGFVAWCSAAPQIVTPAKGGTATAAGATPFPPAGGSTHGLDDTQLAVCSQLGLTPEEFAKGLEETA